MSQEESNGCPFDHENMTVDDLAKLPLPSGKDGLPIVGETINFVRDPKGFPEQLRAEHGDVAYAHVLGSNTVFSRGTAFNRWLFKGENDYLQNQWSRPTATLLGQDCVAMLNGDAHRQRRKLLNPYFHYNRMDDAIEMIDATVKSHLDNWVNADVVVLSMATRALTFEIIARYIFGEIDGLPIEAWREDFQIWTSGIFSVGIDLPFTRYGKALQARKRLWKSLTEVVTQCQEKELGNCILQSMFEIRDDEGQPLSIETIVDEIQVLLFAGHDTTVSALTNILVLLARHPDVVAKGREEQATITEETLASTKGLKNMPYIDAIINEGLRMYAPVTGAFRTMTEDRCFDGYRIPKGWAVSVPIGGTHHNADLWERDDVFEPERFLRDEHKKEPLMFIPFGGGPRMCLGMNFALVTMRLLLAQAFQSYQWELLPDQDLQQRILPTPMPRDGGLVSVSRL